MSLKVFTSDEENQVAEWCKTHPVKRYLPGETSDWDEKPFRQRHAIMATKAASRRRSAKARRK